MTGPLNRRSASRLGWWQVRGSTAPRMEASVVVRAVDCRPQPSRLHRGGRDRAHGPRLRRPTHQRHHHLRPRRAPLVAALHRPPARPPRGRIRPTRRQPPPRRAVRTQRHLARSDTGPAPPLIRSEPGQGWPLLQLRAARGTSELVIRHAPSAGRRSKSRLLPTGGAGALLQGETVDGKGVDEIFVIAAEVGNLADLGRRRLEDRPVPQVVAVLRQIR